MRVEGVIQTAFHWRAARGEEQIAIGIGSLNRRAVCVAVGVGKMCSGGDYAVARKGAVLVKAVPSISER